MALNQHDLTQQRQFEAFMRAHPEYDTRSAFGRVYDAIKKPLFITAGILGVAALGYGAFNYSGSSFQSWVSSKRSNLEQKVQNSPSLTRTHESNRKTNHSHSVPLVESPQSSGTKVYQPSTPDIDDGDSSGLEERVYTPVKNKSRSISSSEIASSKKSSSTRRGFYFSNTEQCHATLQELIRTGREETLGLPECPNFEVSHGQGALDSQTKVPFENILNYHNQNHPSDHIDRLSDIVLEFDNKGKLKASLTSSGNGKIGLVLLYNMANSQPLSIRDGGIFSGNSNFNVNELPFKLKSAGTSYTVGYDPNEYALVAIEFARDSRYTVNGTELGGLVTNISVRRAEVAALQDYKALAFGTGLIAGTLLPEGTTAVNLAALIDGAIGIGNNKGTPKNRIYTGADEAFLRALAEHKPVSSQALTSFTGRSSIHGGVVLNYKWSTKKFSYADIPEMANTVIPLYAGNSEKIKVNGEVSAVILVRQGEKPVVLEPGWLRKLKDSSLDADIYDPANNVNVKDRRIVYTFREYPGVPGKLVEQSNLLDNKWNIHYRPFSYDINIVEMYLVVDSYPTTNVASYSGKETLDSKAGMGSKGGMRDSKGGLDSKAGIDDSKSGMTPSDTYFIHFGNREIERNPHFFAWFAAGYNLHLPDKHNPPNNTNHPPGRSGGPVEGPPSRGGGASGLPGRGGGPVIGPASGSGTGAAGGSVSISGSTTYSSGSYIGGR